MSSIPTDDRLARAKQLVSLYQRRIITQPSLVSELAELIAPDNIREVMSCLPPEVCATVRDWAESLRKDDSSGVVFWPLSRETRLAFKEWLADQQRSNGE